MKDPREIFKNAFYFGVGAVTVTAEKVEQAVDALIQKGEVGQSERAKLIDEFWEKAKEQEKEFTQKVKTIIEKSRQELQLSSRKEIDELSQRIEKLEKKLADYEKSSKKSTSPSSRSKTPKSTSKKSE